jgi:hypothetical protein
MKLDTAVIITKGLCFVAAGVTAPLVTGLAQWSDSGQWPPTINWIVLIAMCVGGGATALLAFLSQSFGNYKVEMKNGNTEIKQ